MFSFYCIVLQHRGFPYPFMIFYWLLHIISHPFSLSSPCSAEIFAGLRKIAAWKQMPTSHCVERRKKAPRLWAQREFPTACVCTGTIQWTESSLEGNLQSFSASIHPKKSKCFFVHWYYIAGDPGDLESCWAEFMHYSKPDESVF